MKEVKELTSKKLYQKASELTRIGNIAVQKAKAENKKMGLPNVFGKNGIVYYELPNGKITSEKPKNF